jgi:hypothetical protein
VHLSGDALKSLECWGMTTLPTAVVCVLQVDQFSGINETNLRNAVEKALHPEQPDADDVATP